MSRPIRLLLLTDTAVQGTGGSERFLRTLLAYLPAQRYRIDLIQLAPPPVTGDRVENIRGAAVHRVEHWPIGPIYGLRGVLAYLRLLFRLSSQGYDLIQSQHEKADLLNALLPRSLGGLHVSSRRDLGFKKSTRLRAAFRRLNRRFDAISAPSAAIVEALHRDEGVPVARQRVIPNGVDLQRFRPPTEVERAAARASLGLAPQTQVVVCVASLSPVKRHADLISAFASVRPQCPDLQLLLVGAGEEEAALRAQVDRLGLAQAVCFLGLRAEVTPVLWAADLCVLASESEGLPNAVLEAQACGLPVVATAVGGTPELIEEGVNGWLVAPRQPEALAHALRAGLSTEWRLAAGRHSRSRVEAHHAAPKVADRYDAFYQALLSQAPESDSGRC